MTLFRWASSSPQFCNAFLGRLVPDEEEAEGEEEAEEEVAEEDEEEETTITRNYGNYSITSNKS